MCFVSHFFAPPFLPPPMAAAYAALLALARSFREISDLQLYVDPLHKGRILSLHEKVDFIVTFLEDYSDRYQETLGPVGNGIRKAAYEAQDFMDSYLYSVSTSAKVNLDRELIMAFERIDFIWEETMKMNIRDTAQEIRSGSNYSSPIDHSSTVKIDAKKMVVGFDDDLNAIKERLYEDSAMLQIIPIVGMGGIGKTTLARRAYEDPLFSQYFDIRAWITVSQEYQRGEILSGLLQSLPKSDNDQSNESEAQLAKLVYQNLVGRRYLIVVDDIWSAEAWEDLKMIFPDDGSGSRILLTTRILDLSAHLGSFDTLVHQMKCLDEDHSWKLLQERVFGQESCPLQLVEVGKKIAKNCGGLPLTITVVAGLLLSSGDVTSKQVWQNISENISSREPTIADQCSKILCFSYDMLPLRLKPCFLYIAAFPEDSKIVVSKLIRLWVAEGFLKPDDRMRFLEDVGERCLEELVSRSLLLVSEKGADGKLETVGIHDMLREICITKAEEEGFLHQVPFETSTIENPYRRLKIPSVRKRFHRLKILESSARSIILICARERRDYLTIYVRSRLVCILDALNVRWRYDSLVKCVPLNLRYVAFTLINDDPRIWRELLLKRPNLETIVIRAMHSVRHLLEVPYEFLKKPKLRHLICHTPLPLSYPSRDIGILHVNESYDLQTIETVRDFIFAQETINILVNLKKLTVEYDMNNRSNWDVFNLDNLFHLQNLEDLKISMIFPVRFTSMIWNHAFPIGLKKLSLKEVPFPWENMTIIGSLPNLQVLEMIKINVDKFSKWTTMEGQFLQLKYFRSSLDYLAEWDTEKEHFPCLESLILNDVWSITEIPSGIGEIDTLHYIEVQKCDESLVRSAMQIRRLQHENGNDAFRVRVTNIAGNDVLF